MVQLLRSLRHGVIASAAALVVATPAFAQADAPKLDSGDTAWMLVATALVLMMTVPGLVLFYGGMVRKKNVLSTVMQIFAVCCLASVLWMIVGYSLAFAEGNAFVGGFDYLFLAGMSVDSLSGTIPESVFMTFQMTFAIITPALITGALLTGVFAVEAIGGTPGLLEGAPGQIVTQAYGIAATIIYCAVATFIILKVIEAVVGLRVDETTETVGLDIKLHGERAYDL